METTFKNQNLAQNPFQLNSEPGYSSNSLKKQKPNSNARHVLNAKEVEYSSEVNTSFDGHEKSYGDQEKRDQDNNKDVSDDFDDMNVSFANQDEDAGSEATENQRGREMKQGYQQRADETGSVETSPDDKPEEGEEDILKELKGIKDELSQTREQQRTGSFQNTPSKNRDLSPKSYVQNFEGFSPNRVVTEDEFKEYYDKFCIAFLKKKEEELLKKRKEKADQELAEMKDKPTLVSKPNSRKYIPLMDRTPILDAKRAREIEKLRQERDEKLQKELDELTFKPKINERSKSICSPKKDQGSRSKSQIRDLSPVANSKINEALFKPKINQNSNNIAKGIIDNTSEDVVDRLYLHADNGNNKKQELKKQLTPNFTPSLNRKSQKIAKQIEDQRIDASQYQSERVNSKERSSSRNYSTNNNPDSDGFTIEQASDADLLEILKQFNQMLKQKNESPINLEQLSALMASYADKRRDQKDENRLDSHQDEQEDENTDEEDEQEDEEDEDRVPYFPNSSSRRCETEPDQKVNKQLSGDKKRGKANKDEDENMANIQRNLKQLEGKLQSASQQKPSSAYNSPKKQTDNEKRTKVQDDETVGFESKRGSQSPKKNGNLMSNLIKNPRTLHKNDDPPTTPISEDLRQKIQEISAKKTSPSKSSYKETSPKKGKSNIDSVSAKSARDYSPMASQKSARDQQPVTSKNNRDITPKGARSIASSLKSSSQKALDPTSQKSTTSSGVKGEKTKVKKGTKKVKKAKNKDEKSEGTQKNVKKSKKSQGANSELSSQAAATIGSKNGLEGWRSPPQEVQDVADEEVFLTNPEDEENLVDNFEDRQMNDYEEDKVREQPGEQTFGTDQQDAEEKPERGYSGKSKDYESYASRKSNESQRNKNNLEASNEAIHESDVLNKLERSRKGSELDRSNASQDQFVEIEREVLIEREKPQTEKVKSHAAAVQSRHGSEYSRSQLSKAVLEEEEEHERGSDEEEQFNSVRSRGQVGSRSNVPSQKSSINHIDDEVKSQKSTSNNDQVANRNQRGNKSLFSNQNHKDERQPQSNHQLNEKSVDENKNNDSFYSNDSYSQSQSTIRESARAKEENNLLPTNKSLKKGSFDDQNTSLSTNRNQRKDEERRGAPAEYASSQTGSEYAGQSRPSRKNAPLRCEVMNTETIQIQPPSQVVKQQYKYAMDGSGKNLTSASSRGLKAMAEHVVQKFKNYDAQIKQTKKEYQVSVSRSESRSRSPEVQEQSSNKKGSIVRSFKTPEKKDVKAQKGELEPRDVSAQKKARASLLTPMTPEKTETINGKKAAQLKRHSVAAPMKNAVGKREL